MSSIQDRNPKVILFVGRPSDSQKGLCLLLEAASILDGLSSLPSFMFWIVGGSPRELALLVRMIDSIASLKKLVNQGRIFLWGRIENSALAEIYSRATVTVVPSHHEEFGIVAVEAMMCGCPVIAARVGGLQDIVVHNLTGALREVVWVVLGPN
jgi:D-inositol-3-phosphate glycosyltransferase